MGDALNLDGLELTVVDTRGLLVGSWFTSISFGVLIVQIGLYIKSQANDPALLKTLVAFLFCLDTTCYGLFLAAAYEQLIKVGVGSLNLYIPPFALVMLPIFGSLIVFLVNSFLIWRYQRLSHRSWLCYALYFVAVVTFGSHFGAATLSLQLRDFKLDQIQKYIKLFKVASKLAKAGLILEVVMVCTTWVLLLVALLQYLRKEMQGTRRIVVRLILITIESGTVATAISAASLAYYLSNPSSSNLIVIATFMARVYFMGMMFTLNMRGNGGQVMRDGSTVNRTPISFGASNSVQLSDIKSHSSYYQHNVIHVRQNVATQVDKHMDGSEVLRSDSEEAKTLECRRKVDEGV